MEGAARSGNAGMRARLWDLRCCAGPDSLGSGASDSEVAALCRDYSAYAQQML
jgi:hypothetical protein